MLSEATWRIPSEKLITIICLYWWAKVWGLFTMSGFFNLAKVKVTDALNIISEINLMWCSYPFLQFSLTKIRVETIFFAQIVLRFNSVANLHKKVKII